MGGCDRHCVHAANPGDAGQRPGGVPGGRPAALPVLGHEPVHAGVSDFQRTGAVLYRPHFRGAEAELVFDRADAHSGLRHLLRQLPEHQIRLRIQGRAEHGHVPCGDADHPDPLHCADSAAAQADQLLRPHFRYRRDLRRAGHSGLHLDSGEGEDLLQQRILEILHCSCHSDGIL